MNGGPGCGPELVVENVIAQLATNGANSLIALDFDGTLAPIVADPSQARPVSGASAVLAALAYEGAQIALISGRDASTVVELSGLGGLTNLIVEGLYGAERWHDGRLTTLPTPLVFDDVRAELRSILATSSPLWLEDKRLSLVVHARRASDPPAALAAVADDLAALARLHGLEVHSGRNVLELRLPGFDKGSALRRVVADTARTHVLFAGDDVGDVPAFEAIAELRRHGLAAWSIVVVSPEVPGLVGHGDLAVDGPRALIDLLNRIAGWANVHRA